MILTKPPSNTINLQKNSAPHSRAGAVFHTPTAFSAAASCLPRIRAKSFFGFLCSQARRAYARPLR